MAALLALFPDRTPPADTDPGQALAAWGRSPWSPQCAGCGRPGPASPWPTASSPLRYRRGPGRRRMAGPLAVETGALVRRMPSGTRSTSAGDASYPTEDVHAGTYLRIGRDRRGVTVRCVGSTRVRAQAGWTPGAQRRWWDVTLSAADVVALQYALAGEGALVVPMAASPVRAGGR